MTKKRVMCSSKDYESGAGIVLVSIFSRMIAWTSHSAIKNIMWSLSELIFIHRDLQQLFTDYRTLKESICWLISEMEL